MEEKLTNTDYVAKEERRFENNVKTDHDKGKKQKGISGVDDFDKKEIETHLEATIKWRELPEAKNSYITISTFKFDPAHRDVWPQQPAWMKKWLEALHDCFHPRIEAGETPQRPPLPPSDSSLLPRKTTNER